MLKKWHFPYSLLIFSIVTVLCGAEVLYARNSSGTSKKNSPSRNSQLQSSGSSLAWSLSMGGYRSEDELNQSTSFDLSARLDYKHELNSLTRIHVKPAFTYSSGYSQTQSQKEASSSDWTIKKAEFAVTPGLGVELSSGALNQREIHSALLWKDQALPALQVSWRSQSVAGWRFRSHVQGAIATSSSLSTNTTDKEKTPTFESYGVGVNYQGPALSSETRISAFAFSNLPQSVATAAATLGNTVTTTNGTDYRFNQEYKGIELQQRWTMYLSRGLNYELRGSFISNQKSTKGLNQAFEIENRLALNSGQQIWTPVYRYFEIQPDATVASYNSSRFETNRTGYQAGLNFQLEKLFQLSLLSGERDVLFESPSQKRERTLSLELETNHDIF
ncbi:MAG: hypothetical protein ACK5RO_11735 [Pseudobdellovibrionaceae bacterium]